MPVEVKGIDPLELELKVVVVSYPPWALGIELGVLCKSSMCF